MLVSSRAMASKDTKSKSVSILKEFEVQRFEDLGLGRGINASDVTPWLNKSSFQVREVKLEEIIGTDEGGACRRFKKEIHSSLTLQAEIQASVAIPQTPVSVDVDTELSHSVSSSRMSVGRKVITRTISFRGDFDDVPRLMKQYMNECTPEEEEEEDSTRDLSADATFQERLCQWILTRIKADEESKTLMDDALRDVEECPGHFAETISRVFYQLKGDKAKKNKWYGAIIRACVKFVQTINVTHYVSAVHLGASEYIVFTKKNYNSRVATKAMAGIGQVGSASVKSKVKRSKSLINRQAFKIGRIGDDDTIVSEAVVEIKITPISTLIRSPNIRWCLEKALHKHMESTRAGTGPFYIAISKDDGLLYLHVEAVSKAVFGTDNFCLASLFFVIDADDASNPDDFFIVYNGKISRPKHKRTGGDSCCPQMQKQKTKDVQSSEDYYLNVPVHIGAQTSGPIKLKQYVEEHNSCFRLVSRVDESSNPVRTTEWIDGGDKFFVKCQRRLRKRGYLAVKHTAGARSNYKWKLCCVKSRELEGNSEDFHMLFQLLPKEYDPVEANERTESARSRSRAAESKHRDDEIEEQEDEAEPTEATPLIAANV